MEIQRIRRALWALVLAAALLAGCGPTAPAPDTTTPPGEATMPPGEATAYPAPAGATPTSDAAYPAPTQ